MHLYIVLVHDGTGRNLRHQLALGDDFSIGCSQDRQKIKRPAAKRHALPLSRQLAPSEIETEWAEGNLMRRHGSEPQGRQLQDIQF